MTSIGLQQILLLQFALFSPLAIRLAEATAQVQVITEEDYLASRKASVRTPPRERNPPREQTPSRDSRKQESARDSRKRTSAPTRSRSSTTDRQKAPPRGTERSSVRLDDRKETKQPEAPRVKPLTAWSDPDFLWDPSTTQRTILQASFERDNGGFSGNVATGIEAKFFFNTKEAAFIGDYGTIVRVDEASSLAANVRLLSPRMELERGFMYTFTVYAKAEIEPATVMAVVVDKDGMKVADTALRLTMNWKNYTAVIFQPVETSTFRFSLNMGQVATSYYFDEIKLVRSAVNSTWSEHNVVKERIDKYRKGFLTLQFVEVGDEEIDPAEFESIEANLITHDFHFGTAFSPEQVTEDKVDWYIDTATTYFNSFTPENKFKWPEYEPNEDNITDAQTLLDTQYVAFTAERKFPLRGHTLEWLSQSAYGGFWAWEQDCAGYQAALKKRIQRDVGHFTGKMQYYHVWNEIIKENFKLDQCDLWLSAFPDAFTWANQIDPDAKLCLNDYNLIDGYAAPRMVEIVNQLKRLGIPIHCIGIQAHLLAGSVAPEAMFHKLEMLASTGLELYISAFSLRSEWPGEFRGGLPINQLSEMDQASLFERYIRWWFSYPGIKGVTLWGFWDGNVWVEDGGLFDMDGVPKEAARRLDALLNQVWTTQVAEKDPKLRIDGLYGWNGFYGTYEYTVKYKGKDYIGNVVFPNNGQQLQTVKVVLD